MAKHSSCDGLLHYKFSTQYVAERTFKIGAIGEVIGKMIDCATLPSPCTFAHAELAR